jgi:ATP synthase F0 subunit b
MQTVETLNQGLKRGYRLTISAKDIDARIDAELKTMAPQVRMPGFRPGKVPANLVRKMHGPALQQQAMETAIQEGVQQLLTDENLRPAMQPSVTLEGGEPGQDIIIGVEVETLPDVPEAKIEGLKLERLQVESQRILATARGEAETIVARTREDANRLRDELRQKAQQEAATIVKNAQRQIELETARAVQQIRHEAVDLSIAIASKLLQRNVSKEDNERLIEDTFRQLEAQRPS